MKQEIIQWQAVRLLQQEHRTRLISITGFKQAESDSATAKYLEVEKKIKDSQEADAVLVSVDSMAALRRAYPNYFFNYQALR
jgi:hypothetical protein